MYFGRARTAYKIGVIHFGGFGVHSIGGTMACWHGNFFVDGPMRGIRAHCLFMACVGSGCLNTRWHFLLIAMVKGRVLPLNAKTHNFMDQPQSVFLNPTLYIPSCSSQLCSLWRWAWGRIKDVFVITHLAARLWPYVAKGG